MHEPFPAMPETREPATPEATQTAQEMSSSESQSSPSSAEPAPRSSVADAPQVEVEEDTTKPDEQRATSNAQIEAQRVAMAKMVSTSADMLAELVGALVTRIPPTIHGTEHYPLGSKERDALAEAIRLVIETRLPSLSMDVPADLMMLALVLFNITYMREGAALQELRERKAKAKAAEAVAHVQTEA